MLVSLLSGENLPQTKQNYYYLKFYKVKVIELIQGRVFPMFLGVSEILSVKILTHNTLYQKFLMYVAK